MTVIDAQIASMTIKNNLDVPIMDGTAIPAELLRLTGNAGVSFEISAAFDNLQKQQENASKAHEYTRLEIESVECKVSLLVSSNI